MRPHRIVPDPPVFNDHFGFFQAVENLAVEQLIPELSVEALNVAVFPGAARLDEKCFGSNIFQPFPDSRGRELGTIVRTYVIRDTPVKKQIRKAVHHVL